MIVGAVLAALTEAYGTHVSSHRSERVHGYFRGLARSIVYESIFIVATLTTALFLVLAATLRWQDDHQNRDGSWVVGYPTIGLNRDVVLLFVLGIVAARRGGFRLRWILLFGLFNACLGRAWPSSTWTSNCGDRLLRL